MKMNRFYKRMVMPVALAAGLTGLAGVVSGAEGQKRDDTYCTILSLNGDRLHDSFCAFVKGDEKTATARIVVGVGNSIGREDETTLETITIGPKDIIGITKTDVNGDGKKDVVLNYGPATNPTKNSITYLSNGDGTVQRK
jgi:hypothetical protein